MSLNLVPFSLLYNGDNSQDLTEYEFGLLFDGITTSSGVDIPEDEATDIICDMGAIYNIESIRYHRKITNSGFVDFFGKHNLDDNWFVLNYTTDGAILSASLDGLNEFRFFRVTHSGTSGTATFYELEIFADTDFVAFGEDAQSTEFSVNSGTSEEIVEPVALYNPSSASRDFFCVLDGFDSTSSGVAVSTSESGTFYTLYENSLSLPTTFSWSSGYFLNTEEQDNRVVITSGVTGYYYSPVIDVSSLEGRRLFWEASVSGIDRIDGLSQEDSLPTIGVRFSNTAPTDGGWASGQLSNDSNWSVVSGSLPFVLVPNNLILDAGYKDYFQVFITLSGVDGSPNPYLTKVGIEEGLKISVPSQDFSNVYLKSIFTDHVAGRDSYLISWFFEE